LATFFFYIQNPTPAAQLEDGQLATRIRRRQGRLLSSEGEAGEWVRCIHFTASDTWTTTGLLAA